MYYFVFSYDTDAPIELRNVTMTIQDGASASVEFTFDEGDYSWTSSYEWNYRANRGRLGAANGATVTKGDDQPMQVSFQGRFSKFKSVADAKPQEILTNADGNYTTTDSSNCATYACNIVLDNSPECDDDQQLLFPDFRIDEEQYGIRDGQVSFTGRCNAVRPTVV
jgi:hypothetical protein